MRQRLERQAGFTIVELVVVMLLLGVLSSVAFSRFVQPSAFAPTIVAQQIRAEVMFAQAQAGNRQDARVAFDLVGVPNGWQMQISNDVDGIVRQTTIDKDNTGISAISGAASATLDTTTALHLEFDGLGGLSDVELGGISGAATSGAQLLVSGDTSLTLCVYPSGYVHAEPCA